MMRSRRLNHFAVGAEFAPRNFSQQLFELKLVLLLAITILMSSLNVPWIRLDADPKGSEKFYADQAGRQHEVVDVHDYRKRHHLELNN